LIQTLGYRLQSVNAHSGSEAIVIGARHRLDDWTWHKDRFEETLGEKLPGRFAVEWPKDVRLAVLFTFDTQGDIDATTAGAPNSMWAPDKINYCDLSMRRYDVAEGLDRVLRILSKHEVRATFPTCGLTAEWYPDAVKKLLDHGHEVAAHGYHHVDLFHLSPTEEREEIGRATDAIGKAIGEQPKGWRSPKYSITDGTLDLLRDAGYVWDSDLQDQSFPYVLRKDGRELVEIPAALDDWGLYLQLSGGASPQMGGTPYGTTEGVLSTLKAEFDILYEESDEEPRVMQLCMHPKITGRPFRAAVLDRLISYIKQHDGARFMTCSALADLA